jgi:hypothetical protein
MLCPQPETEELVELVLLDVGRLIADPNISGAGGGRGGRRVCVLDVGSLGPPERQGRVQHQAGPRWPWGRLQRSSVSRPWVNDRAARWTLCSTESGHADEITKEDNSPEMKLSEETNGGRARPKSPRAKRTKRT